MSRTNKCATIGKCRHHQLIMGLAIGVGMGTGMKCKVTSLEMDMHMDCMED